MTNTEKSPELERAIAEADARGCGVAIIGGTPVVSSLLWAGEVLEYLSGFEGQQLTLPLSED